MGKLRAVVSNPANSWPESCSLYWYIPKKQLMNFIFYFFAVHRRLSTRPNLFIWAGLSHTNRIRWWTWVPLLQITHPDMVQATVFVSIIKRACQRAALRRRLPLQYPPKLGGESHCGWAASLQLQSSLPLQTQPLTPAFKKAEITCCK